MAKLQYLNPLFFSKKLLVKKFLKLNKKNSLIPKNYFSRTLSVYNGKKYVNIIVKPEMVNYKVGQFVFTKLLGYRSKKKKKKK
jgi:ribosomal protein S19